MRTFLKITILLVTAVSLFQSCSSRKPRLNGNVRLEDIRTKEFNGRAVSTIRDAEGNEIFSEWVVHKHNADQPEDQTYVYSKFVSVHGNIGNREMILLAELAEKNTTSIVVDAIILPEGLRDFAAGGPDCHTLSEDVYIAAALYDPDAEGKAQSLKAWGLNLKTKQFIDIPAESVVCAAGMAD